MDFKSTTLTDWKSALSDYPTRISSLDKPDLVTLDSFYRFQLPQLLHLRNPNPFITKPELKQLMQWKLARGKWRPRLMDFVSNLDEELVESASRKAFGSLPHIAKAVSELTVLKGVGPATASAVLAAYAPVVAPFMSDEAMVAALGNSKEYTLKQYLLFVEKLQAKSKGVENGSPNFGFAFLDYAALKFWVGSISDDDSGAALGALLMQVSPKEIVYESTGLSKEAYKALIKYASAGSCWFEEVA